MGATQVDDVLDAMALRQGRVPRVAGEAFLRVLCRGAAPSGMGSWGLHWCPAVLGPCQGCARSRWAHLEVADDAVLLGPIQPAGGGGTQAGGSPHQQVPGGRVAAAAGAAVARVRLLPAAGCRHPHCREHKGAGWGLHQGPRMPAQHPPRPQPSRPIPSPRPNPLMQHEAL